MVDVIAYYTHLLETQLNFYTPQTKHDMEMKLTPTDFSCRVTEGSWLQTLGNQLIDRSPYTRHTIVSLK